MSLHEKRKQRDDFSAMWKAEHSIYETMKVTEKGIEIPIFHWKRMKKGGEILKIEVPDYVSWIKRLQEYLLEIDQQRPYALRVSLSNPNKEITFNKQSTQWSFSFREIPYSQEQYEKGVDIIFLDEVRQDNISLTYIKSTDYLDTRCAVRNVETRGAFEGIWLNVKGELIEGTRSNIFFVQNGVIYTPTTASGCLEGTRRQIVKDLAYKLNLPFQEKKVFSDDLMQAEEVFLTNALMGIMPVRQVENIKIKESTSSISAMLRQSYEKNINY